MSKENEEVFADNYVRQAFEEYIKNVQKTVLFYLIPNENKMKFLKLCTKQFVIVLMVCKLEDIKESVEHEV